MPELPEVETVRAGLEASVRGRTIAQVELARADLRFPLPERFAERVKGRTIQGVERRAKYLLLRLSGGLTLLAHLGMSGQFRYEATPSPRQKHDHVRLIFTRGGCLVFNDARRFGCMDLVATNATETHPLLAHLGPEPLSKAFTPAALKRALEGRSVAIKLALMNQEVVVGVGNIYASEALFRARVSPFLPAREAAASADALVKAVRAVLREAIASGGSSLKDFIHIGGETGHFQHAFAVYGRAGKPCFSCGFEVKRAVQGGRSTFFCPRCQQVRGMPGDKSFLPRKTGPLRAQKKRKNALDAPTRSG